MRVNYRIRAGVFPVLAAICVLASQAHAYITEITQQPTNQTVWEGGSTAFKVSVLAMPPLVYQWRFNGSPIPGAQDSTLILQNVTPSQAGEYDVTISNNAAVLTSTPATLTVRSELHDPGLPRVRLERSSDGLQLHYWLQNTQGVYFIVQSDVATNLWANCVTLTNDVAPSSRASDNTIPLDASQGAKFFAVIEAPGNSPADFVVPESSGQTAFKPLSFVAAQGLPEPLTAGTAFHCDLSLIDNDGAALKVDGLARLALVDATGKPATFSYSITPSFVQFSAGTVAVDITINTSQPLAGCSLALESASQGPANRIIQPSDQLTLDTLIGPSPRNAISMPDALTFAPLPPYTNNLPQAYEPYRQKYGTATPVWGYPFAGGQRPIVGNFGEWYRAGYQIHCGVDFADTAGTEILAAEKGIVAGVVDAGPDSYILIDHGFGYWTLYQNVSVHPPVCQVKLFEPVTKGQLLTQLLDVGPAGPDGDHLHFEIRKARTVEENRMEVNTRPGNAINPQMDPAFQRILFPATSSAPVIQNVALTLRNPSSERFDGVKSLPGTSSPGSAFFLVQAVVPTPSEQLAPADVVFMPSVPFGSGSVSTIGFTDGDQAQLFNPYNTQKLADRGIALYSKEGVGNSFSSTEKFRYWFKWDTSIYAGIRTGPRQATFQADDALGNKSPIITYDFGPEIFAKRLADLGNRSYQLTVVAHLGCMDALLQSSQPDQYKLEVIGSDGKLVPGVLWQNVQPGNLSKLFTVHLEKQQYTFTLPASVDGRTVRVRVTSTLLPDIADEITPSFPPVNITPIPKMVWIPSGTFTIGSPMSEPERYTNEGPQTLVTLTRGFWMSQLEVQQGEYLSLMNTNPSYFNGNRSGPPYYDFNFGVDLTRPVENLNVDEALAYCAKLTDQERKAGHIPTNYVYRLPTEAEWEYACRAGSVTAFSFGPALRSGMANFCDNDEYDASVGTVLETYAVYPARTISVGSFATNAFGLYDMHGNAWEWVSDVYSPYSGTSVIDPQGPGPDAGTEGIMRGGCWETFGYNTRSARRNHHDQSYRYNFCGFRVVLAPK